MRRVNGHRVVPVRGTPVSTRRVGGDGATAGKAKLARLLLDLSGLLLIASGRTWYLAATTFTTGPELVKAKGTRTEMSALVKTTLVADNLARVEGGAAPRGRLGRVAVEAAAAEILGLLRGSVIRMLDLVRSGLSRGGEEGRVRLLVMVMVVVVVKGMCGVSDLRRDNGGGVLELDCLRVLGERVGVSRERVREHGLVLLVVEVLLLLLLLLELGLLAEVVVADVGEGGAANHAVICAQLVLLLVRPLGIVGLVVDVVHVCGWRVGRIVLVQLLEKGAAGSGVRNGCVGPVVVLEHGLVVVLVVGELGNGVVEVLGKRERRKEVVGVRGRGTRGGGGVGVGGGSVGEGVGVVLDGSVHGWRERGEQ